MNLNQKVILITGSTDGIGKETAKQAAKKGAEIIIHGKDQQRIENTKKEIEAFSGKVNVFSIKADFRILEEVCKMADIINERFSKIDILFNNAAGYYHEREITVDGFEMSFQVNYLAHFLLTQKLIPVLENAELAKILNVSSMIHGTSIDFDNLQGESKYSGNSAYSLSKLLNILHAYKLSELTEGENIKSNCLHPGVIETKLLNAAWSGGAPVIEGAENLIYAAESSVTDQMSGLYLENRRPMQSNPISYDKEIQTKLWQFSTEILKKHLL
jgi:NAD(P)-dependent dehydrogenase (short-subunit alcohol dehydrogenase family)